MPFSVRYDTHVSVVNLQLSLNIILIYLVHVSCLTKKYKLAPLKDPPPKCYWLPKQNIATTRNILCSSELDADPVTNIWVSCD